MKLICQITEDEVIAEFLKAEINSGRFRESIVVALQGQDETILHQPDLSHNKENDIRRQVLAETRGFGQNKELFEDFPDDVDWYKAVIEKKELDQVMYIDYSYWNELSNHTRLPMHARENIENDVRVFGASNQTFIEISSALKEGKVFPRLILMSINKSSKIVVLEGHARITGYYLEPTLIPENLEVIIGYSEGFKECGLY